MGFILSTIGGLTLAIVGAFGLYLLYSALRGGRRGKSFLGFIMFIAALGLWSYGSWNDGSVLEGSFLLGAIAALSAVFIAVQWMVPFKGIKPPRAKKATQSSAQSSKPSVEEPILRP